MHGHDVSELTQRARMRVVGEPRLIRYENIIMDQDWPNWLEHVVWVATATVDEILGWATEIERNADPD